MRFRSQYAEMNPNTVLELYAAVKPTIEMYQYLQMRGHSTEMYVLLIRSTEMHVCCLGTTYGDVCNVV